MVAISVDTRVLARLHPERNGRGLKIYNPYFQETGADAIYVLFDNPSAASLLDGIRNLGMCGAIVAGSFETDPAIPDLMDDLHVISRQVGRVGMVAMRDGKLWGAYQGGYGLRDAIQGICPNFLDRSFVIVGAGTVVHALLAIFAHELDVPPQVAVFNRTVRRAEQLATRYPRITRVAPLADLEATGEGDILINATAIGSPWNSGDGYYFSEELLQRFGYAVDVTFVPLETQLTTDARRLGLQVSPGHQMFMHQAKFVLKNTLQLKMEESVFERHMLADFQTNWS